MFSTALTIAGSDPSGGAGLQADLKTFHQRKVYGMAVLTLWTVQNTKGVKAVHVLRPSDVLAQLDAVLEDIRPGAVKTGALGNASVIRALAERFRVLRYPLVLDPVMISKHGARLLEKNAVQTLKKELMPCAALVTPNLPEAELLTGLNIRDIGGMKTAARRILQMGPRAVLIKGGHLQGAASDIFCDARRLTVLAGRRVSTRHTHGTGCTYSACIAAELAKGSEMLSAVRIAKRFISKAIRTSPGLGKGSGPVNHFAEV